jgi:hypothetical protein
MEDNINFLGKCKTTSNLQTHGRRPQFVGNDIQPQFVGNGRLTEFFRQMKDDLNF